MDLTGIYVQGSAMHSQAALGQHFVNQHQGSQQQQHASNSFFSMSH